MTVGRRMSLPGLDALSDVAIADQQHATIRAAVDKLVADAGANVIGNGYDPNDVGVWAHACLSGPLEAALDLVGGDDAEAVMAALVGMLGEAILRLARNATMPEPTL